MSEQLKRDAAAEALKRVESGMRLGLGTGSTAKIFVDLLGERVARGLSVICVPTSEVTAAQARTLGIPLTTLDECPELDLTIDGADEFDADLCLIKGAGGALLREKIVAAASREMLVIADQSKQVERLGLFPLSIEVNVFGLAATRRCVEAICPDVPVKLRLKPDGTPYITDGGHLILDAHMGIIADARALDDALLRVPGVVEHGLFIGLCTAVYVAAPNGVAVLGRSA